MTEEDILKEIDKCKKDYCFNIMQNALKWKYFSEYQINERIKSLRYSQLELRGE